MKTMKQPNARRQNGLFRGAQVGVVLLALQISASACSATLALRSFGFEEHIQRFL